MSTNNKIIPSLDVEQVLNSDSEIKVFNTISLQKRLLKTQDFL